MSYKYHRVVGIRKMCWDQLWHILYEVGGRLTWDKVKRAETPKAVE